MSFDDAIRIDRNRRRIFAGNSSRRNAVHRGRRRKHEMLDAGAVTLLEQVARRAGVVAVVLERIADRFGHDRVRGEVQHRVDLVLGQHTCDGFAIARIADDQWRAKHRAAIAGREIVEHDDAVAALAKLTDDVAADVTGATGDQDRWGCHPPNPSKATRYETQESVRFSASVITGQPAGRASPSASRTCPPGGACSVGPWQITAAIGRRSELSLKSYHSKSRTT